MSIGTESLNLARADIVTPECRYLGFGFVVDRGIAQIRDRTGVVVRSTTAVVRLVADQVWEVQPDGALTATEQVWEVGFGPEGTWTVTRATGCGGCGGPRIEPVS